MVFAAYLLTALWLGVLTSISPCPLASNVAAVSYISGSIKNRKSVVLPGLMYSLGRAVVYAVIAFAAVKSAESMPGIADFLQKYMNKILGPLLVIIGMFLTGLISVNMTSLSVPEKLQAKFANGGPAGAFVLGALFAMAMCPVSAAIFFGSLIPLAIKADSSIVLPLVYGLGTGTPVAVFAFAAAIGAKSMAKLYKNTSVFEKYAQVVTGVVFILAGVYYVLRYIFGIL